MTRFEGFADEGARFFKALAKNAKNQKRPLQRDGRVEWLVFATA